MINKRGTSLVEIIVVIAIFSMIMALSYGFGPSIMNRADVSLKTYQLQKDLNRLYKYSKGSSQDSSGTPVSQLIKINSDNDSWKEYSIYKDIIPTTVVGVKTWNMGVSPPVFSIAPATVRIYNKGSDGKITGGATTKNIIFFKNGVVYYVTQNSSGNVNDADLINANMASNYLLVVSTSGYKKVIAQSSSGNFVVSYSEATPSSGVALPVTSISVDNLDSGSTDTITLSPSKKSIILKYTAANADKASINYFGSVPTGTNQIKEYSVSNFSGLSGSGPFTIVFKLSATSVGGERTAQITVKVSVPTASCSISVSTPQAKVGDNVTVTYSVNDKTQSASWRHDKLSSSVDISPGNHIINFTASKASDHNPGINVYDSANRRDWCSVSFMVIYPYSCGGWYSVDSWTANALCIANSDYFSGSTRAIVNYNDASNYCSTVGGRLPTLDEWQIISSRNRTKGFVYSASGLISESYWANSIDTINANIVFLYGNDNSGSYGSSWAPKTNLINTRCVKNNTNAY
jgi:prepilin-type N-terminal cleavage/methylation domain-containing protein